jgi:predicted membrane protein
MGFLFSGMFWGIVLVIFGASVIVNVLFHVHIPVMRIIFGLIIIYVGVQVITGHRWNPCKSRNACFSSEARFDGSLGNDYSVVFGKNTIDLTTLPVDAKNKTFKVSTVFGASVVIIPSDIPAIIKASSAFSGMNFPNGTTLSFGEYVYKNKAYADQPDAIKVQIDLVFGGCTVIEK